MAPPDDDPRRSPRTKHRTPPDFVPISFGRAPDRSRWISPAVTRAASAAWSTLASSGERMERESSASIAPEIAPEIAPAATAASSRADLSMAALVSQEADPPKGQTKAIRGEPPLHHSHPAPPSSQVPTLSAEPSSIFGSSDAEPDSKKAAYAAASRQCWGWCRASVATSQCLRARTCGHRGRRRGPT